MLPTRSQISCATGSFVPKEHRGFRSGRCRGRRRTAPRRGRSGPERGGQLGAHGLRHGQRLRRGSLSDPGAISRRRKRIAITTSSNADKGRAAFALGGPAVRPAAGRESSAPPLSKCSPGRAAGAAATCDGVNRGCAAQRRLPSDGAAMTGRPDQIEAALRRLKSMVRGCGGILRSASACEIRWRPPRTRSIRRGSRRPAPGDTSPTTVSTAPCSPMTGVATAPAPRGDGLVYHRVAGSANVLEHVMDALAVVRGHGRVARQRPCEVLVDEVLVCIGEGTSPVAVTCAASGHPSGSSPE